ncbi:hypothetical protein DGo_PC0232 (plasmid) [Deinococcus gobiensis I-0]|uniref:Uncharacterized protein n=1 Tax=Deinococcus gobiensis (strain DSM 21396 / JCM 16679 / CGMCC 1.7299 / I-0) TaxID=745776 RepID=H8H3C7_DEIGI|nr:hypothetical protein DGo_PC0232 [Deinococcus gobiensis I-0]
MHQHQETGAWNAWEARERAIRAVRTHAVIGPQVRAAVQASERAQQATRTAARRQQHALRGVARQHLRDAVALAREIAQPFYPYPVTDFDVRCIVLGVLHPPQA